mmetsp:Transcript_21796/g.36726  ORF Transcript_21796/g.36726 Transcript_21796/m.36726 type:complete len:437 (+) Transcript_21796:48-1358(+)
MISLFVKATALLTLFSRPIAAEKAPECRYYLTRSKLDGAMRGVFAGKNFEAEEHVEAGPVVNVKSEHIKHMQLFNYVYGSEADDESIVVFGVAMMYNHRNPKTVEHLWGGEPPNPVEHANMVRNEAYTQFCGITYQTVTPITAGSEMYTSYGDNSWFASRNVQIAPDLPITEIPLSELQSSGAQCLSHLYVEESEVPMAGKGVYSKASYDEGDTVYISPVLVLPKQQLRMHEDSDVLLNYCISEEGSDAALLPIGLTGMLNHGGTHSNVRMEWFTGEGDENRLNLPLSELEDLPFAPLDIRYVATRPIAQGEELLLDYGTAWSQQWLQHLDRLIEWNENFSDRPLKALKPQFREPIGAPEGFFPAHFKSECIGKASCNESPSIKRRKAFTAMHRKLKRKELYEASKASVLDGAPAVAVDNDSGADRGAEGSIQSEL